VHTDEQHGPCPRGAEVVQGQCETGNRQCKGERARAGWGGARAGRGAQGEGPLTIRLKRHSKHQKASASSGKSSRKGARMSHMPWQKPVRGSIHECTARRVHMRALCRSSLK